MSRQYPDKPVFGVGAVIFDGGRVLLIKRGQAPLKGHWSLPGGAQEIGETAHEALSREIREETGLEIEIIRFLTLVDIIERDKKGKVRHHYTVADYLCQALGGDLSPEGDAADARWVAMEELETYSLTPKAREVIEKAWLTLKNI